MGRCKLDGQAILGGSVGSVNCDSDKITKMTKVHFWEYMKKKTPICVYCGKKIPFNSRMMKYCNTRCRSAFYIEKKRKERADAR